MQESEFDLHSEIKKLSPGAEDVALQELARLVAVMSYPHDFNSDGSEKNDYIAGCFMYWKLGITTLAEYYSAYIDADDNETRVPFLLATGPHAWLNSFSLGAHHGDRLIGDWRRRIEADRVTQRHDHAIAGGNQRVPSRKEFYESHTHVEAIIFLAQVIAHSKNIEKTTK